MPAPSEECRNVLGHRWGRSPQDVAETAHGICGPLPDRSAARCGHNLLRASQIPNGPAPACREAKKPFRPTAGNLGLAIFRAVIATALPHCRKDLQCAPDP